MCVCGGDKAFISFLSFTLLSEWMNEGWEEALVSFMFWVFHRHILVLILGQNIQNSQLKGEVEYSFRGLSTLSCNAGSSWWVWWRNWFILGQSGRSQSSKAMEEAVQPCHSHSETSHPIGLYLWVWDFLGDIIDLHHKSRARRTGMGKIKEKLTCSTDSVSLNLEEV